VSLWFISSVRSKQILTMWANRNAWDRGED
jgi:hypothetical protein